MTSSSELNSEYLIYDDFSSEKLFQYDQSHMEKCLFNCGKYRAYKYLEESTGNKFIRLTTTIGQLSHFNKNSKHMKDRIELGTKDNKISKRWLDLENKTFWWNFDVKLPENSKRLNGEAVTITQLKTIDKDQRKKQCHPGMPFRINYNENYTWIAVTDGFDKKLNKEEYFHNILDTEWTNFKIGYHFSRNVGWVEVRRNKKVIFEYFGNTIFDKYQSCKPVSELQTFIRIGLYRKSKDKNTKDDSLDFDNYIICKGDLKSCNFN